MTIARRILVALAWLFVLGVTLQFFFAGLGTMGGRSLDLHEAFGYSALYLFPILILIAALVGRLPRTTVLLSLLLVVVSLVQPFWAREFSGEFLGSLHVLGALVIFVLAHAIAQRATRSMREAAQ